MTSAEGALTVEQAALRLWPGIVAAVAIVIGLSLPAVMPAAGMGGVIGAMVGALIVLLWWLFFSRARWSERIGVLALLIAAWFATRPLLHASIIGGAMGALPVFAFTLLAVALVFWASTARHLARGPRLASLVVAMVIACGLCTTVRTDGIGAEGFEFRWRWTPTPEERLLARGNDDPAPIPPTPSSTTAAEEAPVLEATPSPVTTSPLPTRVRKPPEWPGFRGADRDSVVRGVLIETDWSKSPPVALWRRPIGPGWSSFAVDGDLLYTQEQRGDDELVAAYRVSTGEPVWRHRDPARFWESNGGPGPRGTPTINGGRVYAFGATGILNALDARTGAVIWSHNVASESGTEVPMWGFSSSPLVIDDTVVVAAAGKLAAYDVGTGTRRWFGPGSGFSYSSPHRLTIDGVTQILLLGGDSATSVSPSDGSVLWKHAWPGGAIVQPAVVGEGQILINSLAPTGGQGIRRLAVTRGPAGAWTVEERWTSNGLKPYYDDFVVHKGYAFGADGSILACIDLSDGTRKWKGGRYGGGQVILLADQDVLLVLSEEGELALVSATPDQFKEIARVPALEGKTWNHPVVVRDVLLIRNGEEMAAFRLPLLSR